LPGGGTRRFLQPMLYLGIAALAHGLLFLIPGRFGPSTGQDRTRGIRVRAVSETAPRAPARQPEPAIPSSPLLPPTAVADTNFSSPGGTTQGRSLIPTGPRGADGGGSSASLPAQGDGPGGESHASQTEYGAYLARLRSEGVQGWAKDTADRMRQGWKGSGKSGVGWGSGTGSGEGGTGGKGQGGGGAGTGGFLDPRVRMVVTSYPPTSIERRYTAVTYPDLKVRKTQPTAGWWNVYFQIWTDENGKMVKIVRLRPETDGAVERMFVEQVRKEIDRWKFDRTEAEILVDVRFHVE